MTKLDYEAIEAELTRGWGKHSYGITYDPITAAVVRADVTVWDEALMDFIKTGDKSCVCLVGAVGVAHDTLSLDAERLTQESKLPEAVVELYGERMETLLGVDSEGLADHIADVAQFKRSGAVIEFNDNADTTLDDVLAVVKLAAELESKELVNA